MRLEQAVPDAGLVHFDAQEVPVRVLRGLLHQAFPVAEADLEDQRRLPAENRREVERSGRIVQAVDGPEFFERTLLR